MGVRWKWVIALAFAIFGLPGIGWAEKNTGGAVQPLQPNRFALIIGVGPKYTELGSLPMLQNSCDEANAVAAALRANNWTDVIVEPCDATNDQLYADIRKFKDKVDATDRAFALLYYTGHGIQVGGVNYIFGADTDIDVDALAQKAQETHQIVFDHVDETSHQFIRSSVDIAEPFDTLKSPYAKEVVVLLDACRDNPVEEKLNELGVSVSYPTKVANQTGVSYLFSSKDGKVSQTGGGSDLSPFTKELVSSLSQISQEVSEGRQPEANNLIMFASQVRSNVLRNTKFLQDPEFDQQVIIPPEYCIQGCPSTRIEWDQNRSKTIIISSNRSSAAHAMAHTGSSLGPDFVRFAPSTGSSTTIAMPTVQRVAYVVPATTAMPSRPVAMPAPRPMRFDVFWCDGDAGASEREAQALQIGHAIVDQKNASATGAAGLSLGLVRVRSLPPAINAKPGYRRNDFGIFLDSNDAVEKAWGAQIKSTIAPDVHIHTTTEATPGYISLFVCQGYKPAAELATVYIQVATEMQKPAAAAIRLSTQEAVPGVRIESGIQTVDKSPDSTVVRYFKVDQRAAAELLADFLTKTLNHLVRAIPVPGYQKSLKSAPVIEIWFGKDEHFPEHMADPTISPPDSPALSIPKAAGGV